MTKPLTIILGLPSPFLNPNNEPRTAGGHKRKDRIKKAAKHDAHMCALSALNGNTPPRWVAATVHVRALFPNMRNMGRRDRDNFIGSLKFQMDSITEAGVMLNDKGVHWGTVDLSGIDKAFPRVELTFVPQ